VKGSYSHATMLGGAAIVLTIGGTAACLGSGLMRTLQHSQGQGVIEREWSPTSPKCNLEDAGNAIGVGLVLYCAPSGSRQAEWPTWLYSAGVVYTITDSAGSLTPKIRAMADADDEAFHLAGFDRQRFREQVADMIAEQRKQKTAP
jgi:hypothetical protein